MAAIDRLYTKYYSDARNLVIWLSNKRPSMLENLYDVSFSKDDFNERKEEKYESSLKYNKRDYERWELDKGKKHALKKMIDFHKSFGNLNIKIIHDLNEEIDDIYAMKKALNDKNLFVCDINIPIACFKFSQDRWLKWHCPLSFIRQYLKDNCGMKEHWYYKLFFKYYNYA